MRVLSALAAAIYVIALPLLLITTNVRFLAGEVRFYERGFREYNAAAATGIKLPELDRAAREMIDYFENDASTLRTVVDAGGQEEALFNAREVEHMRDVKRIMRFVFRVNEVSLGYVLVYVTAVFLWSRETSLRRLAVLSLLGIGVGVVVTGAIGGLAATGFDAAWTQFHELVFQNDLWRLDPQTDRLIQMYPEPFWEEATFFIGVLTVAECVLVIVLSTAYLVSSRGRREPAVREPERRVRESA